MKNKETLEEVFDKIDDKLCRYSTEESEYWNHYKIGVLDGLKWQQENSNVDVLEFEISTLKSLIQDMDSTIKSKYSEEEVVSFIHKFIKEHQPQLPYLIGGINMWFQQYKKK
jgi:hypothetical protein